MLANILTKGKFTKKKLFLIFKWLILLSKAPFIVELLIHQETSNMAGFEIFCISYKAVIETRQSQLYRPDPVYGQ